ncbi:membrane protein YqaA with SNARE-associated domain [Kitasatospora sp. MAA4]|uniref:hypothetical protein n=1 Tax=Kitasatospora sp. MAA4 TaxID=3035093 RepID=UPI0024756F03|nr:hypothetical protein [Kitasatospora sp. MAA4]MDH6133944.1 membrane protein YqaA with SNARE-associated domain [Kitasatospora sp. MAA4]
MDSQENWPDAGYVPVVAAVVSSVACAAASRDLPDALGFLVSVGIGSVVGGAARWWTSRARLREFMEAEQRSQLRT